MVERERRLAIQWEYHCALLGPAALSRHGDCYPPGDSLPGGPPEAREKPQRTVSRADRLLVAVCGAWTCAVCALRHGEGTFPQDLPRRECRGRAHRPHPPGLLSLARP